MVEYLPLLKKNLLGKTIPQNGYLYEFKKVEFDETLFLFTVNTILPVKGGGFLLEKIYDDVSEIVANIFNYIGQQFTISVQVYVDGEDVDSSFIPFDDVVKVYDEANSKDNHITVLMDKENVVKVILKYSPLRKFNNSVQFDDGIAFIVHVDVTSVLLNGVEVQPDLSFDTNESIFVSYLTDHMTNKFEDTMYTILEPSFQFLDNENFYYNAYLNIKSYKGREIKDVGVSATKKDFLSILKPL